MSNEKRQPSGVQHAKRERRDCLIDCSCGAEAMYLRDWPKHLANYSQADHVTLSLRDFGRMATALKNAGFTMERVIGEPNRGDTLAGQPSGVGEPPAAAEVARAIVERYFEGPLEDEGRWGHKLWRDITILIEAERKFAALAAAAPKPAPPTFEVPFQKPLTVLLIQDRSQEQASTDVATIKKNDSTVLRIGSEMYFNQLRLECAKDPTLLDKIAVFYRDENNVLHSVGLSFEDELKWPPGFLQEAWSLEAEISKVRHPALAAPAPKPAPPAEPEAQVCKEILRIMDTYHEQEKSSYGIDTPGGLEHMGDVWRLFAKWDLVLRRAAERKPPR